ncbi:hypothetical protein CsatB_026671 [Cannabis sativa]
MRVGSRKHIFKLWTANQLNVHPEMVGRLEKGGYWLVLYRKRYNRSKNGGN